MRARAHVPLACLGKESFADFKRAELVASKIARRSEDRVRPYRCRHCHAWHVGSTVGEAANPIREAREA